MGKNADKDKSKGPDKKAEEEPLPEDFRPKERLANDPTKKHNIKRIEKAEERRERRDGPRGKPNAAKDAGTGEASATTTAAAAKYGRRKFNGRGYRFVAVRGVFPLRAQVQELSRAIGETTMTLKDIQELVQFQDFRLERQTARPGADPWSGPWETVEREPAIELLTNEANNLAPETVADGIVDSHICMPYPDRLVGEWATLATHPQIRDFVLSSEEVEEQMNYERRVLDRMKDAEDKKKEAAQSGGFTGVSRNMRDLQRRATQSTATVKSVQQELLEEIKKNKGDVDQAEINERLKKYITDRSNAIDHLLLFRYLDTTVEQGKTYRYRVKLVLENPFSQRHLEEVADPSIIEGATRETDYSEPTKPIHVPEDARFFVKAVDGRAGGPSLPLASLDVYQWFASTGTVVNKVIRAQIGQLVGGKERAQVLRPSDQTFDVESVPFATGKALVDVAPGASLDSNLHADILGELSTNAKRSSGAVPDEAVVVDENGTLFVLDDLEQAADHARARKRYEFQIRPFEDLRKSESKDDDGIKRLEGMSKHNKAGGLTKSAKGKHSADPRRKPKAFRKDKRQ